MIQQGASGEQLKPTFGSTYFTPGAPCLMWRPVMYAKIFEQIMDSSIAEDYTTRHIFMDLLVLADKEGFIDRTQESIARRLNIPLNIVAVNIVKLCEPDPCSRNKAEEGRRLIPISDNRDWGWKVVNYEYYHQLLNEDAKREKHRLYMQKRRAKEKACEDSVNACEACEDSVSNVGHIDVDVKADVEAEAKKEYVKDLPPFSAIQTTWNQTAKALDIAEIREMTEKRKVVLRQRWSSKTWQRDWQPALQQIKNCPFLLGVSKQGWVANFDWFLRPDSVTKILEGAYSRKDEPELMLTPEEKEEIASQARYDAIGKPEQ